MSLARGLWNKLGGVKEAAPAAAVKEKEKTPEK